MAWRTSTPLSIAVALAFAFLLLSVLSAPIIPAITIASFEGVDFGVFGWCSSSGCSGIQIGYNMDEVIKNETSSDFSLPSGARTSLSNLLIVHPVAALLTLVLWLLSVTTHARGPGHSPRYLLVCLVMTLPAFIASLLAFLVDVLIFIPHVQWAGWLVLASTILIMIGGFTVCGMRRTIVGHAARSKRIQENAEMNGNAHFARAAQNYPSPGAGDKLPEFATFEVNKSGEPEGERIPLNPRSRTVSPPPEDMGFTRSDTLRSDRSMYGPPPRGNGPLMSPGPRGPGGPIRNQYSNMTLDTSNTGSSGPYGHPQPMRQGTYPPSNGRGYGYPGPPQPYGPLNNDRFGPSLSPGPGQGYRGPPPGAPGAFNPRPGPPPGAYGSQRGPPPNWNGPPGGMMGGGYGPPPRGDGPPGGAMGGSGYGPAPRLGGPIVMMGRGMPGARRSMTAPPDFNEPEFPAGLDNHVDEREEFEKTLGVINPNMIGVACSDDGMEGSQSGSLRSRPAPQEMPVPRSPGPVTAGGLSAVNELPAGPHDNNANGGMIYAPPHAQWEQRHPTPPIQTATPPPVELPAGPDGSSTPLPPPPHGLQPSPLADTPSSPTTSSPNRVSGYYEDVLPAFDQSHTPLQPPAPPRSTSPHVPNTFTTPNAPANHAVPIQTPASPPLNPGAQPQQTPQTPPAARALGMPPMDMPPPPMDGPWSPPPIPEDTEPQSPGAESSFTSISQRGINPRWLESEEGQAQGGRGRVRGSVGLQGNPDFELPAMVAMRGRGRGGRGRGMR